MGLRARLDTQLITGLSYIELDFVDPKKYPVPTVPWKPEAEFVPSVPSAFAQVQNAGQQLLAKLDQVDVAELVTSLTTLSNKMQPGVGQRGSASDADLGDRPLYLRRHSGEGG